MMFGTFIGCQLRHNGAVTEDINLFDISDVVDEFALASAEDTRGDRRGEFGTTGVVGTAGVHPVRDAR